MKQTLWLHIGPHKTGTSSIQQAMQTYDDGVTRYARLGPSNHSVALTCAFRTALTESVALARHGISLSDAAGIGADTREVLQEELATPGQTLILSAEAMSLFTQTDFGALAGWVQTDVARLRVLAYARDPLGRLSSLVQQVVRAGGVDLDRLSFPYRDQFEAALAVFGRENLMVRRFDPKTFQGGSLIGDFCHCVGADPAGRDLAHLRSGLSREALGLLVKWNQTEDAQQGSTERFRARNRTINLLTRNFPGRFRLSPDFAARLLPEGDLDWLRDEIGIDFTADLRTAQALPDDLGSIDDLRVVSDQTRARLADLARNRGLAPEVTSVDGILTGLLQQFLDR